MEGVSLITGFRASDVGGDGLCILHLLFTDDTILFCDATFDHILIYKMIADLL